MINVCFYIHSLAGTGGTERITSALANYLANNNYKVSVIAKMGGSKKFHSLDEKIDFFYLHEGMEINIYINYLKTISRYRRIIDKVRPDYIIDIGVNLFLETLPATLFKPIKRISWEHFNANVYHNYLINYLSKFLAVKLSDRLIVLTDDDKSIYIDRFNAKRIDTITCPVLIDEDNIQYNNTTNYALAVGRLVPQKGFDLLLKSWKEVSEKAPNWKLRIVGDGICKDELQQLAKDLEILDSIEFISANNNIQYYFKNSSIFIMSSRFEGFGLVLIEAKWFGLPIVSFNCNFGPSSIIRDQIDGILVEPENIRELSEAVIDLMNDPIKRNTFSERAILDSKRFSPTEFYDRWIHLLK
ncbi:glycosyltransferase family 4 protein [Siphonobacter sp. SORGH_AS_1065]|uniref:glycosyltransferase family 4 protein n=1 Tax=Siphonobacter sp. SORGH_AS_1065 TaxID=3041795 RepID=UPI00278BADB4|nr:glycosyltransferase family 4 protein [Siphonobacter sp. SORGH_AS_1065]MDQ1087553.1 glycosyltransferase involved in cell wall biosynthesis [Siphonobacter sp. SORGH_AS_1065]